VSRAVGRCKICYGTHVHHGSLSVCLICWPCGVLSHKALGTRLIRTGQHMMPIVDVLRKVRSALPTFPGRPPPRQNGCRPDRFCIWGADSHVVVGGCGVCGRRSARWSTRSVVHGKPAGARSASSTNPQPCIRPRRSGACSLFQQTGGDLREQIGTIRTGIQRQSGGAVVAAGERGVGRRLA
jgi:hypothetical protein